ncbi:MAG: GAF domain-containing protein [Chloroflexota bacterium]
MEAKECRYCRALSQVAVTINSSLDPQQVLRAVSQSTAEALGTKGCSILLLSPDRKELYHSAGYGLSDWYVRKGPMSVDRSMAESLEGRSIVVLDASTDPRVQYRPQAVHEGIASILSVPLRLRDQVVGVMRVYTAQAREFDAEEIRFVESVANLGAVALENARRYEEVKTSCEGVRQDLLDWYAIWGLERTVDALAGTALTEES